MRRAHVLACVLGATAYVADIAAPRRRRPSPRQGLLGGTVEGAAAYELADGEVEVELARPLGVTVQEGPGGRVLVQGCRAGGRAEAAGVAAGDEIIGVSAVFGADVWGCEGAGLDRVEGLIRAREGSVTLRLRRGDGAPAAAADGLGEEDVDAYAFRAIFDDDPDAFDGPSPDGDADDALLASILVGDFVLPDAPG